MAFFTMVCAKGLCCIKTYKNNGEENWAVNTEDFYIWLFLM